MFDKLEFSDVYKFIASLGIVIIISSILIPFYIIQVDVFKIYQDVSISSLPINIQNIVCKRINLVELLIDYWWIMSSLLFIVGIIITIFGIKQWYKRQNILDQLQNLDLVEKESRLQNAKPNEIKNKASEDADEIFETDIGKNEFLQNYRSIEQRVIDAFNTFCMNNSKYDLNIRNNTKLGNFIYDLIVIQKRGEFKRNHFVCEIKYYNKNISHNNLLSGINSFLLSLQNYSNNINVDNYINVIPTIIWIYSNQDLQNYLNDNINKYMIIAKNKGYNLRIVLCSESEINSIPKKVLEYITIFRKKNLTTAST